MIDYILEIYIYGDIFSSSLDIFLFFVDAGNEMGTEQDRRDLPFPFQNRTTAPTDYWIFGSRLFVQANFTFPEENLRDIALVFRGRRSSVHLPVFCLT